MTQSIQKTTQLKIDYKEYPEYMFAMISAFLPTSEGDDLRRVAGKVIFKHTDKNGRTYKNGLLHSYNDQPAIIEGDRRVWYKNGKIHRDGDLPAIIDQYQQGWFQNGEIHRDGDLPAFINSNTEQWYKNGNLYRAGGIPPIKLRLIMW